MFFKFKKFFTDAGSFGISKIVILPRYSFCYTLEEYRGELTEDAYPHRAYKSNNSPDKCGFILLSWPQKRSTSYYETMIGELAKTRSFKRFPWGSEYCLVRLCYLYKYCLEKKKLHSMPTIFHTLNYSRFFFFLKGKYQSDRQTHVYSSFIYNCQNLEATKMPFSRWMHK